MAVTLGCAPGSCPCSPIVVRVGDGPPEPLTFRTPFGSFHVADLDALADQTPGPEAPAPAVVGLRVFVPAVALESTRRDYPRGRAWTTEDDGSLLVEDEHGDPVAEFPAGHWCGVETLLAEAAE